MRIHLLPPQLANQIAAGEVIERPCSVVKELLENSLDAGAKKIQITIEKGGLQLIKVTDDGRGIHVADLSLALAPHATSKIQSLSDLENIKSLGFRGEALASISSVSRLLLTSNTEQQEHAWSVQASGREMTVKVQPAAHPIGTTVEVRDLFFNTPARRRFLSSEKTEFAHIETCVKQLALSDFSKSFVLVHNEREILNLRSAIDTAARNKRVSKICGAEFMNNSALIDIEATGLRLHGWLGLPSVAVNHTHLQYFYINGRIVRDKIINHAIRQAYEELLPPGRYSCYVLYLELDPQSVDVNVHPTKHEVRFHQTRLIHDFIVNALKQVLKNSSNHPIESLAAATKEIYYQTPTASPIETLIRESLPIYKVDTPIEPSQRNTENDTATSTTIFGTWLALLQQQFILTRTEEGLGVINITKAFSSLINAKLLSAWKAHTISSIPLLMPKSLTLTPALESCFNNSQSLFTELGFDFSLFPGQKLLMRQIPTALNHCKLDEAIFESLKYVMTHKITPMSVPKIIHLIAHTAQASTPWDEVAAKQLLNDLEQAQHNEVLLHSDAYFWNLSCNSIQQHFINEV